VHPELIEGLMASNRSTGMVWLSETFSHVSPDYPDLLALKFDVH